MGHERVGFLPKSKSWNKVVDSIQDYSEDKSKVDSIAYQTLQNIRQKYLGLSNDSAFLASFKCLVALSYANKENDPINFLNKNGIGINEHGSLFQLTTATQKFIERQNGSKEYSVLATKAVIDTINNWVNTHQPSINLFGKNESIISSWEKAATGAGFCEVSRDYFSRFTTNYLSYFLDRVASAQINSVIDRNQFSESIKRHITEISKHAFETSKIAQSFSAGWFNSNAKNEMPSDKKIKGFLGVVTKKFHDEFIREQRGTKS